MKTPIIPTAALIAITAFSLAGCSTHKEEHHHEAHKIVVTEPQSKTVTLVQPYVCQIHSQRHIELRALERGYLEKIPVREGQKVKKKDTLFTIIPVLYQTRLDAENAEANVAAMEYQFSKTLQDKKVVSPNEVLLLEAKMAKAKAKAKQAEAELNFTKVIAPYDGIIDRLRHQEGSLIEEGEILTTLSDNSVMWVYFNMPEKQYLEYMADLKNHKEGLKIELQLADGTKFNQPGTINAIEADFNNENGNIPFRADFPNPDHLLRHGQTGTLLISRTEPNNVVIPQRAVFEVLAKQYVFVIDKDNVAHQREIEVGEELEDLYVVKSGVTAKDKIVLEGILQVHDSEPVEYENRKAEAVVANLKYHAE